MDKTLHCKGRCILLNGVITETGTHNHPPDSVLDEKRKFHIALRTAAHKKLGTFKEYYEIYARVSLLLGIYLIISSLLHAISKIGRIREVIFKSQFSRFPAAAAKASYSTLARNFQRWSGENTTDKKSPVKKSTVDQNKIGPKKSLVKKSTVHQNKIEPNEEIHSVQQLISELAQNANLLTYNVTISKQRSLHRITANSVKDGQYTHLIIYDKELMETIYDARKIIVHKITSIVPKNCGTHVISIIFEKYEKVNI